MSAPPPRIVVRVGPDGTVTAQTHGILGPTCLDSIAVLEDLLDATTHHSAFTADYDRRETTTEAQDRAEVQPEVQHELRRH